MARKKPCAARTVPTPTILEAIKEAAKAAATEAVLAALPPCEVTREEESKQAFFEGLHNLLWNKAGLSPEKAMEHMMLFFAYRMIEPHVDTFGLPQECRWSYVASLTDNNDVFEALKKGVNQFRTKPVTKMFFKPLEIQKADVLHDIVRHIGRITTKALHDTDVLGDIFEYMLGRGMSTMADEGQYFTNRKICALAFKLAFEAKKTLRRADGSLCTFADWFCGTGGFPTAFVKGVNVNVPDVDWVKDASSIYCQDMSTSSVTTTLLNLLIQTGIPFSNKNIRGAVNSFTDSITLGADAPFPGLGVDYCFMNPPYGGDKTKGKDYKFTYSKKIKGEGKSVTTVFSVNAEIQTIGVEDDDKVSAGIQLAMATLAADGGVCSIVLPQGFFFGASKKCVELRKKLAEEYKILSVVDIASGAFANTGTKTSMMVFQRGVGPTESVTFMDMEETVLVSATLEELRAKNYTLNYKQYLAQTAEAVEGFEMVRLGELVTIVGGKFTTTFSKENPGSYPFFSGKSHQPDGTCKEFCFDGDEYIIMIKDGGSGAGNYGDSVGLGKVFFVKGKSAGTSHNVALHKKNDTFDLKYVYCVLNTIKAKITDLAKFTTGLGVIGQEDLRNIPIPLPSLDRQREIVEEIDGWTTLAHMEETSLKQLERQVQYLVKDMGRGKERVKLGEVCEIKTGKKLEKSGIIEGEVPVIGGGISPMGYHNVSTHSEYIPIVSQRGTAGHVSRYFTKTWVTPNAVIPSRKSNERIATDDMLYFILKNEQWEIDNIVEKTAQPLLTIGNLKDINIRIPSLTDQEILQPHFDEIRHKHAKIAEYNAKAQDAIRRTIPGAAV